MIVLIGCVKAKGLRPTEARYLYTSNLFRLSYQWAKVRKAEVWILSAKHGLIRDTQRIGPYNDTLKDKTPEELKAWGRMVALSLNALPEDDTVILAGVSYLAFTPFIKRQVRNPMKGLGIGKRKAWLKQNMAP